MVMLTSCHTMGLFSRRPAIVPVVRPVEQTVPTPVVPVPQETTVTKQSLTWQDQLRISLYQLTGDSLMNRSQLGLCVFDLSDNQWIYRYNADQRMRPASCEKVVTAVSALHYLGGQYQLRTKVCVTGQVTKDGALNGNVYVVGGMDPMLSSGDVRQMARALQQIGVKQIDGKLYVDLSMKDSDPLGWGWCWDDKYGPLTVLSVDGKDNFADEWLKALKDCKITVPASARTQADRKRISGVLQMPVAGQLEQAACPSSAQIVLEVTHGIDQLLMKMMKDSENIYAESLFYQIAAHSGVKNAGRKQASGLINALIDGLGLQSSDYQIADGSGLSLYNYVSPTLLCTLLQYAWQRPEIRSVLLPTLPVCGQDGTLKNRMKDDSPAYGRVQAKTGTVDGISSLSGYVSGANGHVYCFSIINQGVTKGSEGRAFQDRVCELLATFK